VADGKRQGEKPDVKLVCEEDMPLVNEFEAYLFEVGSKNRGRRAWLLEVYSTLFVLSLDTLGTLGDTSLLYDTYRESLRCALETPDTYSFQRFPAVHRRVITLF